MRDDPKSGDHAPEHEYGPSSVFLPNCAFPASHCDLIEKEHSPETAMAL
jgi:hypothetical protein